MHEGGEEGDMMNIQEFCEWVCGEVSAPEGVRDIDIIGRVYTTYKKIMISESDIDSNSKL